MATFEHPYIKLIRPQSPADYPFSNSIFIQDDVNILIDLGSGAGAYRPMAEEVDMVLFTHYHFDHIHGWPMFNDHCVMVGQEEIGFFEDAEKFLRSNGYFRWPELMEEEKEVVWERSNNSAEENPEVLARFGPPAIAINSCFHDGQIFDSGHVKFQAVHLPGHSPGHYGFYFLEEGLLFSADYDLAPFGPWYGGEYCSYGQVLRSMQRIIDIQPRLLFGSHRRKVFDQVSSNVQAYMNIPLRREAAIMAALERPMSFKQLCRDESVRMPLSGDPHEVFWDRMMLLKQLEYYTEAGALRLNDDGVYEKN